MRAKAAIQDLDKMAATLEFPRHDSMLSRYKEALCRILDANFGVRHIDYDDYSGVYYWEQEHTGIIAKINGACVLVKRNFEIDPKKPLAEELERIAAEREQFRDDCIALSKAVVGLGGSS